MATKKTAQSGKTSKNTVKKSKRTQAQKKNYLPTYIISLIIITILTTIFMYINSGSGGVINIAIKWTFCGLFGVCGFFVPFALAGCTAYLIKTKDIRRFWIKMLFSLLTLINVSALIDLAHFESISNSFYIGYIFFKGGGLLGGCIAAIMIKLVQKIASYIILTFTLIILASVVTGVSLISAAVKWIKRAVNDAKTRYDEGRENYGNYEDEIRDDSYYHEDDRSDILEAANSFATDTEKKTKKNANKSPTKKTDKEKKDEDIIKTENDFSNGIDEIFGNMNDAGKAETKKAPESRTLTDEEKGEKREEKRERASGISDNEKKAFNDEFNEAIEKTAVKYVFPSVSLLNKPTAASGDKREQMRKTAEKLISVLDNFGVKAKLLQVTQGPTVTRYEIQPDTGVKLSKIVGLADDIALNLAVSTVLVAPVPGKAAVGVEIPNNKVSPVSIREMLESESFKGAKSKLTVALGKDIGGNVVIGDIAKMPHVLIAGATGSGKSVCINTIIMSILFKASPEDVKLIMIDPKVVELGVYNGIPHLLVPVVTEPKKAAGALNWAVTEMMRRYDLFKDTGVRKLESYNKLMESTGGEKIPQLVVIIDELADLMMVAAKEVEDYVCRLAQLARAAGIHLIIATQRPSVDVITGLIKANIPSRIAFAVSSQVDSRTILDKGGAEKLLGMGDMLYHPSGARASTRVQGAFVSDPEIENVLEFIKENVGETHYSEDLAEEIERHATGENGVTPDVEEDGDSLLPEAIELAVSLGKISTSMVQRRLGVGYSRAGRIIDQMEARGIISGANGSKPRDVLVNHADLTTSGEEEYDE